MLLAFKNVIDKRWHHLGLVCNYVTQSSTLIHLNLSWVPRASEFDDCTHFNQIKSGRELNYSNMFNRVGKNRDHGEGGADYCVQ